jgi:tetratricopeptide (TPR) repeat protein
LEPLLDRPGQQEREVTLLLPVLAWAYLETGAAAKAEALLAQGIERATAQHMRLALPDMLRLRGMALRCQGRQVEAECSFQDALALARGMSYPYAEARILHEDGIMQAWKREAQQARDRFEEALAIFRRLGARPYIERTERDLAALSH